MLLKLFYGDYVEPQYYNDYGGKKAKNTYGSGRLVTNNICAIYYSFKDVLSDTGIKKSRDIGGKNPLLVCRDYFNINIKIPTSGGSSNTR